MKKFITLITLIIPLLAASQITQYTAFRVWAIDSFRLGDRWIRKVSTNLNSPDSNSHNMIATNRAIMDMIRSGPGGTITGGSEGIRKNGATLELGDIAGQNTTTFTVDRYLRGGNRSIYLMGNKTNEGVANFIFRDSLFATAGNPRFKTWMQFDALDHVAAPFYMGTASVDDGTGFNNHVMNWGFNLSPAGTRVNPAYGAIGISCEGAFQDLQEFHVFWIPKDNIQRRALSITGDTAAKTLDAYFQVNSFELKDVDAGQEPWVAFTGGQGGTSTNANLYAGSTNQYRLNTGFSVLGGNTSASISTDGPGQRELHIDNTTGGWGTVFLPSMRTSTTSNIFTTQTLPATDGNLRFGDPTTKWQTINGYYVRAATGMYIGDYSGDELPNSPMEIIAPGSPDGSIHIQGTNNSNAGVFAKSPGGGNAQFVGYAKTGSGVTAALGLVDFDNTSNSAGMSLERTPSPLMGGTQNDLIISNSTNGRSILFGTNSGAGRTTRMSINSTGTVNIVGLAGGGLQMATIDNNGNLGTAAIPAAGITSINSQTGPAITLASGTTGNDFNIAQASNTITFHLPSASSTARGAVNTTTQTFAGAKTFEQQVTVTATAHAAKLRLQGNVSSNTEIGVGGIGLQADGITFNDGGAARTVSNANRFHFIGQPTATATNAVTYSNYTATFGIVGAPIAGSNMTLTTPYALHANDVSFLEGVAMGVNEQNSAITLADPTINIYNGATDTWTLPDLAANPGKVYYIKNAGSGTLTIQRAGSDNIYTSSSVTSFTIAAGSSNKIVGGTSFWYVLN